jgi:hypothetical protein
MELRQDNRDSDRPLWTITSPGAARTVVMESAMPTDLAEDLLSPGVFSAADDGYFSEHGRFLEQCRRVRVGPTVLATFENAQTLAFRLRELRAYVQLTNDDAARRQLEWYEQLLPTGNRLVVSMMVRNRLRGTAINSMAETIARGDVRLIIGDRCILGYPIEGGGRDSIVGLVQWVAFDFEYEDVLAFEDLDVPVALDIAADGYDWQSETFTDDVRVSLLGDLATD